MKLVFLAVSVSMALMVDCRSQLGPEPPDSQSSIIAENPQWPDFTIGPHDPEETTFITSEQIQGLGVTLGTQDSEETTLEETTSIITEPEWFNPEEESRQSDSDSEGQQPDFTLGPDLITEEATLEETRSEETAPTTTEPVEPSTDGFAWDGRKFDLEEKSRQSDRESRSKRCPEHLGFFKLPNPSNQCFKLFNDTTRNWTESYTKCQFERLRLARVYDYSGIDLRNYIVKNYGSSKCTWIGARSVGYYVKWVDYDVAIPSTNPLWMPGHPVNSTSYCLDLRTGYNTHAFYTDPCSHRHHYALCELVYE